MKFSNMDKLNKQRPKKKEHNEDIVLYRDLSWGGKVKVNIKQKIVYFSPTGFEWGYGCLGSAELALNILYLFLDFPRAWKLHQDFKWEFIAGIERSGGTISAAKIKEWIEKKLISMKMCDKSLDKVQ